MVMTLITHLHPWIDIESTREFLDGRERRRRNGRSSPSSPPPSLVTTTTIAISPIPHRSPPPPSLLRSVFTGVATNTVIYLSQIDENVESEDDVYSKNDADQGNDDQHTRMLQSLTGMPSAAFEDTAENLMKVEDAYRL
ncbi:uncharacterized protein LOC130500088 [Raphanus sativus]|uniref:Uncharacterized protein LOC130500088 n=1 Tax=Raphanus sativus TaxID=3726 RepID=A0A9W3CGP3_RAPSA|nr:uncharacterized protein LOC130500088 [Raphanus sativus]